MAFKTGKNNIVHKKQAEINRLKEEINRMRRAKYVERFAHEIGRNIMIILGNTPYDRWPDIAKTSFTHAAHNQETSAHFYREGLPRE